MNKIKRVCYISIIFSLIQNLFAAPGADDVREALARIIKKKPEPIKNDFFTKLLEMIVDFISNNSKKIGDVGFIIVLLIIIAVVFFAVIMISKFLSKKSYKNYSGKQNKSNLNKTGRPYLELFRSGEKAAELGNYSKAVIYLHESTVQFLIDRKYLSIGEEYTNNEIKRILKKDKKYLKAFVEIAYQSEIVMFKHLKIEENIFSPLLLLYKKDFLEAV